MVFYIDPSIDSDKNSNESDAEATVESSEDAGQDSATAKTQEASTSEDKTDHDEVAEQELYFSKSKQLLLILGLAAISVLLIVFVMRRGRQQAFQSAGNLMGGDEGGAMTATTQLNLARAYIEMGDNNAARNALNEVVQHGDADQKANAQDLLVKLHTENR